MAKQKKVTGARVEYWKNKKGEFNYRIIGKNGKLLASINQGFKRKAGMAKNIQALANFFCIDTNRQTLRDIIEIRK